MFGNSICLDSSLHPPPATPVPTVTQTLTGTDLLQISHQHSPAVVKVECYYTEKFSDVKPPSPHSDTFSISIHRWKPELSVHHAPGENVLFTCSLPESAGPVTKCNLYFGDESRPAFTTTICGKSEKTKRLFCQFYVTINDFQHHLSSLRQKVASCDFTLESELSSLSPRSDRYNLTNIMTVESLILPTLPTSTMTTGPTVGVAQSPPVTPSKQPSDIMTVESLILPTLPTSTMTTAVVEKESQTWTRSTKIESTGLKGPTVGVPQSPPVTPSKQPSDFHPSSAAADTVFLLETWKWVVTTLGVTVGVVLLGMALLCTKRGTQRSFCKRKQTHATVAEDSMHMNNPNRGNLLPKGTDEFYCVIPSTSGADCTAGNKNIEKKVQHDEESFVYNIYSTISEDQPTSAPKDMVYSTLQPQ